MPRTRRTFKADARPMESFNELLSGIVRVGPECSGYKKPYEFAVAWSSVDGKTAIIKALTKPTDTHVFTMAHARSIIRVLRAIGLKSDWTRFKEETLP